MSTTIAHRRVPFVLMALAITCLLVLVGLAVCPVAAFAGNDHEMGLKDAKGNRVIAYFPKGDSLTNSYWIHADAKITQVKCSNAKVLSAKAYHDKYSDEVQLRAKKVGSATVTFKCKGKSYRVTFIAKKHTNPFKSLKVGAKEYKSKFANEFAVESKSEFSGKLTVKPAPGWKIKNILVDGKKAKNGAKMSDETWMVEVIVFNPGQKLTQTMYLYC